MEGMDFTAASVDELEQFITGIEAAVGRGRAAQMAALRELDRRQVPMADGCRSLSEWVTSRLDVAPDTAKTLVATARRLEELPVVEKAASVGDLTFDRTAAVARFTRPGDDEHVVLDATGGLDVAGIWRHTASRRRMSRRQEHQGFRDQYVTTQPNLDHTGLDFHGHLTGIASRVFQEALHSVGDALPNGPETTSRTARNAHALYKISQDALTGSSDAVESSVPMVTVFVDADTATGGETGVTLDSGIRVGPNILEAVACNSVIEVTTIVDGVPLNVGRRSRVISPQLRRYILHRDGGVCTTDGCVSRYRLEPHHITPWSQGGRTDADNLTTLCWYHHHVVIHGQGFRIDPTSPPCRRRFNPPRHHDPP